MSSSPHRTFDRLLGALDELVAQETATLASGDFEAVADIQQRAAPLVDGLTALGAEAADDIARARVAALLARRQHNIDFIETQLATAREELLALQEGARRVARVLPVYGRADGGKNAIVPKLNLAG